MSFGRSPKRTVVAVAAALLPALLGSPAAPCWGGGPAQAEAEKALRDLEESIRKASTLKLRFYRRSFEKADVGADGVPTRSLPIDSGRLLLKEGNRIQFILFKPTNPPGGLPIEFVRVSDGKKFTSLMRDVGEVIAETSEDTVKGLQAQAAAGLTRGGIDFAELLMPDASAALDARDAFWPLPAVSGVTLADAEPGVRRLVYSLDKRAPGVRITLWFDAKTLKPLRMAREDQARGNYLEVYEEFALNEPMADAEFILPPGKGEEDITVADYLDLKKDGKLREVWLEDRDLRADLLQPFLKDGKKHFKVHVLLSKDLIATEKGIRPLIEGIDPGRVHRVPSR
jgi:outer membrane lipoprotein-sorting protein